MAQYDLQYSHLLVNPQYQHVTPNYQSYGQSPSPPEYYSPQYYPASPPQIDEPIVPTSRTVYLGNIPAETTPEELLNHVHSGAVESLKMVPEKNCAFISFLNPNAAAHFFSDAIFKKLSLNSHDIKVGWGKSSPVSTQVSLAIAQDGASRNVYLGNLPEDVTQQEIYDELSTKFGAIDTIKLIKEKNIGFVHFLNVSTAIKVVQQLPLDPAWANRKVFYGKDRCAYISKTQQQNAAQYLGIAPGYEHLLVGADREIISSALAQQSAAAIAVATAAGGAGNAGNRTVYLGSVHPETTTEEICNVVRGGLLHHIKYIPEKHICFVTFVDPTAAAQFFATANLQGLAIHNKRLRIGWGKHSGPLPNAIAMAVTAGASRNVYIGNIGDNWPESKLRLDFSEYGEIEQINFLTEKSCAFVNFTNLANAIKAIENIKNKDEYKKFKINFGKDRCGNPFRQQQQQQQQYSHMMQQQVAPSQAGFHQHQQQFGMIPEGYVLYDAPRHDPDEESTTHSADIMMAKSMSYQNTSSRTSPEPATADAAAPTGSAVVESAEAAAAAPDPVASTSVESPKRVVVEDQPVVPLDEAKAAAVAAAAALSFGIVPVVGAN